VRGIDFEDEILAQIVGSREAEHQLDKYAHQIADEIRELTPEFGDLPPKRDAPVWGKSGDAKAAIQVLPGGPGRRIVQSDDPKAIWIEVGTRHMPEYAPFTKVAAMHGGTGPIVEQGIQHAQHKLREALEHLEKLGAEGATAAAIARQRQAVDTARNARSAAFRAARSGNRRSSGRGRRGRR
jgi:hypothetical protein